tara:strand:- start:148 stop:357 length:210 start_codon:yes stop_codon:yes gene_type:complete
MELHLHRTADIKVQQYTSIDGKNQWTELVITDDEGKMDRIVFFPRHNAPPVNITAECPVAAPDKVEIGI